MGSAASRVSRSVETINCQVDPEVGVQFVSAFRAVENLAQKFPTRILNTTRSMAKELRDVAPGLWLWRVDYPDWHPGLVWERTVTSTCVESGGEVVLLPGKSART
jgi:hypothetical protein